MTKNRKNILIACDSPRSLIDFRGKLIEQLILDHDVSLFTPRIEHPDVRRELLALRINIFETDLNPSNVSIAADLRYIFKLNSIIKKVKPDVFFPYAFKPVIYGAFVANFQNVFRITPMLTGLGYNYLNVDNQSTLVQRLTRLLLKLSLRDNNRLRIIFQNKDDYNTLLKANTITRRNKVFIVNGSGVDLRHYSYSLPNVRSVNFLMISRLINAKGVKEFYEAAEIIKKKYTHVNFTLIGPYDDNIDAIDTALFKKIKSNLVINYIGMVKDVRPYIINSSVVVLPSYYGEGVPRCILEGMAMGRAIITSNSVGCKETINPHLKNTNGFLVPVKNVRELAVKMEYYINHKDDIIRFGVNGRKYVEDRFDVDKVNQQMLKILLE